MKEKCAVLFSGGVDSAVVTLLMKKRGLDARGFFMDIGINSKDVIEQAYKMAKALNIELEIINVSGEFKKRVIDYFKNEYSNLRTPNPCVECNHWIKFGILFNKIRELGYDKIITGHYIQLSITNYELSIKERHKLFKAGDGKKDQSYFLYNMTQEQLKYLEFPLGELTKKEVWEIAEENNLPISGKESQDICFLNGDHNKYLEENLVLKKGPIVDKEGKVIGEHFGLPLYAIGQRRWIKIGGTGPYYVLGADVKTNTLFITDHFDDKDLYSKSFEVSNINWISGEPCQTGEGHSVDVKIRYLHPAVPVESISQKNEKEYIIKLKEPQRAITLGQSAVFYVGRELLGGGIIQKVF